MFSVELIVYCRSRLYYFVIYNNNIRFLLRSCVYPIYSLYADYVYERIYKFISAFVLCVFFSFVFCSSFRSSLTMLALSLSLPPNSFILWCVCVYLSWSTCAETCTLTMFSHRRRINFQGLRLVSHRLYRHTYKRNKTKTNEWDKKKRLDRLT